MLRSNNLRGSVADAVVRAVRGRLDPALNHVWRNSDDPVRHASEATCGQHGHRGAAQRVLKVLVHSEVRD